MKEADDITILVEQHAKEIWALKQELVRMKKRTQEVEKSRPLNTMDEVAYRELEAHVKELDNSLAIALEVNDSHQRYNGKLQTRLTEVEEDNKKLSLQIENKILLLLLPEVQAIVGEDDEKAEEQGYTPYMPRDAEPDWQKLRRAEK
jgi:hypothetical protein